MLVCFASLSLTLSPIPAAYQAGQAMPGAAQGAAGPPPPPQPIPCDTERPEERGVDIVVKRRGVAVKQILVRDPFDQEYRPITGPGRWLEVPMVARASLNRDQSVDLSDVRPELPYSNCVFDIKARMQDGSVVIRRKQQLCGQYVWEFTTARRNRLYARPW